MDSTETQPIPNISALSEYISKSEFAKSPMCPLRESEFNWLFKQRENNGFAKAFVKFSSRGFLVHIPTFITCLNERKGL